MPPRIRNCHSGSVKDNQQIHKRIRYFIIAMKKVTHKKYGRLLLWRENNYGHAGKWLTRGGGVYILRDFQKTKIDQLFFLIYSSLDKLGLFRELFFYYFCVYCARKKTWILLLFRGNCWRKYTFIGTIGPMTQLFTKFCVILNLYHYYFHALKKCIL